MEITEIQIRRWGTVPSIEFSWAEGYVVDDKFTAKDMHREQIPDATDILGVKTNGKATLEESIVKALLQWLIDNKKIDGSIK